MTVVDPIFPTLWDATLWEVGHETPLWEVFADSPNFYKGVDPLVQAEEAEIVLQRIRADGWATICERPFGSHAEADVRALSDQEVERAVAAARTWFLTAFGRERPPDDLLAVFLSPTAKWRQWADGKPAVGGAQ